MYGKSFPGSHIGMKSFRESMSAEGRLALLHKNDIKHYLFSPKHMYMLATLNGLPRPYLHVNIHIHIHTHLYIFYEYVTIIKCS